MTLPARWPPSLRSSLRCDAHSGGHLMSFHIESFLPENHLAEALRADVAAGLTRVPKDLPPKWFYDERGSALFDEITRLLESGRALAGEYPGLAVHAVLADFESHLEMLPDLLAGGRPRLTAFLGGTIGNLAPQPRAEFLAAVRASTAVGDWLLLGTDLVKDPSVLVAAYDDAAGVTAEFNRNVLHVINRELKADFDVEAYRHVALWDAEREWIEMRLRASRPMRVRVAQLVLDVGFAEGEELRTEVSAKFREHGVRAELAAA